MNFGGKPNTTKIVNVIRHLKELAFDNHLKIDCAKVKREHRKFNGAKGVTVGLLYHFSDQETDKMITEFVSELRDNNRKVTVLGHYKDNVLPEYYSQKSDWNIIVPQIVNWYNRPHAPFVKSFCNQEFDILIDLTMEDIQPILYAGALSKAHFKTGRYTERNVKSYDLLIHTEHVQTLHEFIQYIKHYISKVNC